MSHTMLSTQNEIMCTRVLKESIHCIFIWYTLPFYKQPVEIVFGRKIILFYNTTILLKYLKFTCVLSAWSFIKNAVNYLRCCCYGKNFLLLSTAILFPCNMWKRWCTDSAVVFPLLINTRCTWTAHVHLALFNAVMNKI